MVDEVSILSLIRTLRWTIIIKNLQVGISRLATWAGDVIETWAGESWGWTTFTRFVISIYLGYLVSNRYFSQNLVSKRCLFDSKVSTLWKYVKRTIYYKCEVHGAHILCYTNTQIFLALLWSGALYLQF